MVVVSVVDNVENWDRVVGTKVSVIVSDPTFEVMTVCPECVVSGGGPGDASAPEGSTEGAGRFGSLLEWPKGVQPIPDGPTTAVSVLLSALTIVVVINFVTVEN